MGRYVCSFEAHPHNKLDYTCEHEPRPNKYNGHEVCTDCFDRLKRQSDADWKARNAELAACLDCAAVNARAYEVDQRRDTLDPTSRYGEHIPLLCRNHHGYAEQPTWHTKNISAGRSIFHGRGTECSCPGYELFSPGRFIHRLLSLLGSDTIFPYGG